MLAHPGLLSAVAPRLVDADIRIELMLAAPLLVQAHTSYSQDWLSTCARCYYQPHFLNAMFTRHDLHVRPLDYRADLFAD